MQKIYLSEVSQNRSWKWENVIFWHNERAVASSSIEAEQSACSVWQAVPLSTSAVTFRITSFTKITWRTIKHRELLRV